MMRWFVLGLFAVASIVVGIITGPADISVAEALKGIAGSGVHSTVTIVRDLRLPRSLLAFTVGGSLAVTGAVLQALVRNPLAEPYLLGLSGGAGLGAVLAISLGLGGAWTLPLAAALGALVAIALVYRLALVTGSMLDTRVLLFSGVVVGAFATAIVGALLAVSPAAELRNALLWMLGGFSLASWHSLMVFSLYAAVPITILLLLARPLDLISLGEEPAQYLGQDTERLKRVLYIISSLLTAAAVAVSGIVGFVGLVVPHGVRIVWGHVHRKLLPAAFLAGGVLMVTADAVARTLFAPVELPVGVVTALVGVPVFAVLVRRWVR